MARCPEAREGDRVDCPWCGREGAGQPGTRRRDHLIGNLGSVDVRLGAADLSEMDQAFSRLKVQGGRMNSDQMRVFEP